MQVADLQLGLRRSPTSRQTRHARHCLRQRYDVPIAFGRAYVRADYSWHDRVQFNVLNDFNNQGPVGVLNGPISPTSATPRLYRVEGTYQLRVAR